MSSDFVYKPLYVYCPHCGCAIPAKDVNSGAVWACPQCSRPLSPGSTNLEIETTTEG